MLCACGLWQMKRDTHEKACTELHAHAYTVPPTLIHTHAAPALTGTVLQQCTFISEVIGAAVSKLKENIQ